MTDERFAELLEAYIDGTLGEVDARELIAALDADPALAARMAEEIGTAQALERIQHSGSGNLAPQVLAALFRPSQKIALRDRVLSQIDTRVSNPVQRKRSSRKVMRAGRRRPEVLSAWAVAAAAGVALVFGLFVMTSGGGNPRNAVRNESPKPVKQIDGARGTTFEYEQLQRAEQRRREIEAELAALQQRRDALMNEAAASPGKNPEQLPANPAAVDAERARVLAELEERRAAAARELQEAEAQRRDAAQRLAAATPKMPLQPGPIAAVQQPPHAKKALGRISAVATGAHIYRSGSGATDNAAAEIELHAGDRIETTLGTARQYALSLVLFSGARVDLAAGTSLIVTDGVSAELQHGLLYADVDKDTSGQTGKGEYKWLLRTPHGNVGITGTRFDLNAENNETTVHMEEGVIHFFNNAGSQTVRAFEQSRIRGRQSPVKPAFVSPAAIWRGRLQALPPPSVVRLVLADCDTALAVHGFEDIKDGAELRLAALPTKNFTLVAVTWPAQIGSVRFGVNNNANAQTESEFPYCISTDTDGNARPWTIKAGAYEITATPFEGASGTGTAGQPLKITLRVAE